MLLIFMHTTYPPLAVVRLCLIFIFFTFVCFARQYKGKKWLLKNKAEAENSDYVFTI